MNTMDIESRMAALERLTAEIQTFNGNIASIRQVIMDLSVELDKLKESNRPLVELKDEIERVRQAKKDGLIDNFIYASVSPSYLAAVLDTL